MTGPHGPGTPGALERAGAGLRGRLVIAGRVVVALVPLLTLLLASWEWNGIPGQPYRDSAAYYDAARVAAGNGAIYEPPPPPGPHEFRARYHYLYPPPLAALLSLLPDTGYRSFDRGWLMLNLAAFWVFAAALAKIATGRWAGSGVLAWGAALFFIPGAWIGIHFGNIEIMVLALVGVGLAVPAITGFALGLGSAFKVTPVWPLLTRALRHPGSTLPGVVAAAVACAGACLVVFGLEGTVGLIRQWLQDIMPTLSQGQFWGESLAGLRSGHLRVIDYVNNLSLSFLPVQLAVLNGWPYPGGELPAGVRAWLTLVAVLVPLAAAWLTRRRSSTVQAAVVYAAALLAAPIVRPYHIAPALLLVLAALRGERRTAGSTHAGGGVHAREQHRDTVLVHDPPPG